MFAIGVSATRVGDVAATSCPKSTLLNSAASRLGWRVTEWSSLLLPLVRTSRIGIGLVAFSKKCWDVEDTSHLTGGDGPFIITQRTSVEVAPTIGLREKVTRSNSI